MDLLPGEHEQQALLDGLAAIVEARGFDTFVCAPLLEPDSRFFLSPGNQVCAASARWRFGCFAMQVASKKTLP